MEFGSEQEKESGCHFGEQNEDAAGYELDAVVPAEPEENTRKKSDIVAETLRCFLPGIEVVEEDDMIILRKKT